MRISDWSSDVCSSDLRTQAGTLEGVLALVGRAVVLRAEDGNGGTGLGQTVGVDEVECRPQVHGSLDDRARHGGTAVGEALRSEEHTSELQSLMRISYAVFCLKKKRKQKYHPYTTA